MGWVALVMLGVAAACAAVGLRPRARGGAVGVAAGWDRWVSSSPVLPVAAGHRAARSAVASAMPGSRVARAAVGRAADGAPVVVCHVDDGRGGGWVLCSAWRAGPAPAGVVVRHGWHHEAARVAGGASVAAAWEGAAWVRLGRAGAPRAVRTGR